jgi:hypothetical protein
MADRKFCGVLPGRGVSVNRTDRHMIGLQGAGFGAAKMLISWQACAKAKAPGAKAGSGKNVQSAAAHWKHAQLAA